MHKTCTNLVVIKNSILTFVLCCIVCCTIVRCARLKCAIGWNERKSRLVTRNLFRFFGHCCCWCYLCVRPLFSFVFVISRFHTAFRAQVIIYYSILDREWLDCMRFKFLIVYSFFQMRISRKPELSEWKKKHHRIKAHEF